MRGERMELFWKKENKKYQINYGFNKKFYAERLVEQPFLFRHIDEPPKSVLDIGCWESIISPQLAMLGYDVIGVDIQDYGYKHRNFRFIKGDFNQIAFDKKFDVIIDISAIEHFGLPVYTNTTVDLDADKKAIAKVKELLKPRGQFIFTAPYGISGIYNNFERIYDEMDILRFFEGFKINTIKYYLITPTEIKEISKEEANIPHQKEKYAIVCISARLEEKIRD